MNGNHMTFGAYVYDSEEGGARGVGWVSPFNVYAWHKLDWALNV